MKKREVSLKAFPEVKARLSNHHTIPLFEDNMHDAAAIHIIGINDFLSNVKSINKICKDIVDIGAGIITLA